MVMASVAVLVVVVLLLLIFVVHRASLLGLLAEMLQVGLHIAQPQRAAPCPLVDHGRDLLEAVRVPAAVAGLEPAADEEVRVHQLVQEGRDEQAAVVGRVLEYGAAQDDQRLVPAPLGRARPPQRRRPDDPASAASAAALVASLGDATRRPLPVDAARQPALEEDVVGGAEDALQGGVVEREVGRLVGVGPRVDQGAQDPLVALDVRAGARHVLLHLERGLVVLLRREVGTGEGGLQVRLGHDHAARVGALHEAGDGRGREASIFAVRGRGLVIVVMVVPVLVVVVIVVMLSVVGLQAHFSMWRWCLCLCLCWRGALSDYEEAVFWLWRRRPSYDIRGPFSGTRCMV